MKIVEFLLSFILFVLLTIIFNITAVYSYITSLDWNGAFPSVLGAIIGALAAAIPAHIQFQKTLDRAQKQSNLEFERLNNARIYKIVANLSLILARVTSVKKSFINPVTLDLQSEGLWKDLMPLAGINRLEISFDANDFIPFYEIGKSDITNRIMILNERFHSVAVLMEHYAADRIKLLDSFKIIESSRNQATAQILPEEIAAVETKVYALNELAKDLCSVIIENQKQAGPLAKDFTMTARLILNNPSFNPFSLPTKPQ